MSFEQTGGWFNLGKVAIYLGDIDMRDADWCCAVQQLTIEEAYDFWNNPMAIHMAAVLTMPVLKTDDEHLRPWPRYGSEITQETAGVSGRSL